MRSHRVTALRTRPPRLRWDWIALGSCALAVGCAPAPATTPESVTQRTSALSECVSPASACTTAITTEQGPSFSQIFTAAKDWLSLFADGSAKEISGYKVGSDTLTALIDTFAPTTSPDLDADLTCIDGEFSCYFSESSWQQTAGFYNQYSSQVETAWQSIPNILVDPVLAADDYSTTTAATHAVGQFEMFAHVYVPQTTDGSSKDAYGNPQTPWKSIIDDHDPELLLDQGTNTYAQFDWRIGFPRFLTLIPKEMMIIGAYDPTFITDGRSNEVVEGVGSSWQTDSDPGYRHQLQQLLNQTVNGSTKPSIRCQAKDRYNDVNGGYSYTDIACADVNTGIAAQTIYYVPASTSCNVYEGAEFLGTDHTCITNLWTTYNLLPGLEDPLRRQILSQMPIFEVQSMVDTLRRFTHPAPDLTEAQGRIPLAANNGLCLDVQWGNSAPGTPVWLWDCTGSVAQQWSYNRPAQTITNTAFNMCLQVRQTTAVDPATGVVSPADDRSAGALAEISDCVSPTPPRQQWTYDPEGGVIRSALGTVLDVKWNNQQPETTVWLWDADGQTAQQWQADHDDAYCNPICDATCPSACSSSCGGSCSGAGPNTGECIGACMGQCVGTCMGQCLNACLTSWP